MNLFSSAYNALGDFVNNITGEKAKEEAQAKIDDSNLLLAKKATDVKKQGGDASRLVSQAKINPQVAYQAPAKKSMTFSVGDNMTPKQTKVAQAVVAKPETPTSKVSLLDVLNNIPTAAKTIYQSVVDYNEKQTQESNIKKQGYFNALQPGSLTKVRNNLTQEEKIAYEEGKKELSSMMTDIGFTVGGLDDIAKKGLDDIGRAVLKGVKENKPLQEITEKLVDEGKVFLNKAGINVNHLNLSNEEKDALNTFINHNASEINDVKNGVLTNQDVLAKAREEKKVLEKVITKEQTEKNAALVLKARQRMTALQDTIFNKKGTPEQLKSAAEELMNTMKIVKSAAADAGRKLQTFKIDASAAGSENQVVSKLLANMEKAGVKIDELSDEISKVDWNNAQSIQDFYRKYVKASIPEIITEFRYNNMLSNPRTFERNLFSNIVQSTIVRPATKLTTAGVDLFEHIITGGNSARENLFKEVPAYYSGMGKAIPKAWEAFTDVFKGTAGISNPDFINQIPTGKLPKWFRAPTLALEATDRFLMEMVAGGEKSALLKKGLTEQVADKQANEIAKYSLFRGGIDPKNKSGQGKMLSAIDSFISGVDGLRNKAGGALSWFIPFVKTPANFAKQWLEYNPVGLLTLPGAKDKKAQMAKAIIGSTVIAMGAKMAAEDRTTWGVPTDSKAKELFFASGKKPYSVKVGDKWVPMMYLGPLALSMAVPAAFKYYFEENPKSVTDDFIEKSLKGISGTAEFLSQQTFLEQLGNFVDIFKGDPTATLSKNLAYTSGQMIPWQGMIRYVSTIIDPVFRKADSFLDSLQSGIPFLSKELEAYTEPTGEESKRNMSSFLAPYDIGNAKDEYDKLLNLRDEQLQVNNFLRNNDAAINKKALQLLKGIQTAKTQEEADGYAKQLSGDENKLLRNTVIELAKKQAIYQAATVEPLMMFKNDPSALAEIIYGKIMMADTKEESEQANEFVLQAQEAGLLDENVINAMKNIITKEQEQESAKQSEGE